MYLSVCLPITSLSKKPSESFKVLLINIIEARSLGTIDIDYCDSLFQPFVCQSAHLNKDLTGYKPINPSTQRKREKKKGKRKREHASPPTKIGTTISLLLSASQAICPGKASTSSATTLSRFSAAVPQTPFPNRIRWQAGFPWKGPRSNWFVPAVA